MQVSFGVITPAFGNIKAGNLRALAVTSPKRIGAAAGRADGVRDPGCPASRSCSTTACWRPPARRRPIVDKINEAMRVAIANEEVRKRIAADGGEAVSSTPEEYGAIVDRDMSALVGADQETQPEGRMMKRSDSRILTTHTGSLPRPPDLVALLNKKELGEPYDRRRFDARIARAIAEVVRQQADDRHRRRRRRRAQQGQLDGLCAGAARPGSRRSTRR